MWRQGAAQHLYLCPWLFASARNGAKQHIGWAIIEQVWRKIRERQAKTRGACGKALRIGPGTEQSWQAQVERTNDSDCFASRFRLRIVQSFVRMDREIDEEGSGRILQCSFNKFKANAGNHNIFPQTLQGRVFNVQSAQAGEKTF